jgi:hypothetical protein
MVVSGKWASRTGEAAPPAKAEAVPVAGVADVRL